MAMKGYSIFPKAPELEPHHLIVKRHIPDIRSGRLTPLQRWCQGILQLQLTGHIYTFVSIFIQCLSIYRYILGQTKMTWTCTRLQCVIAAENLTTYKGYEPTRHAGANDIILLSKNVNRMMALWIRNTPTVFRSLLLRDSGLETFLGSQEFCDPRVIR